MKPLNILTRSESTVKARWLIWSCQTLMWWLNIQPCDVASHVPTAYKGSSNEKNFKIELLQYWKVAVVQLISCADQWYITVYCYKVHKIETKIIKNKFSHIKINLDWFFGWQKNTAIEISMIIVLPEKILRSKGLVAPSYFKQAYLWQPLLCFIAIS